MDREYIDFQTAAFGCILVDILNPYVNISLMIPSFSEPTLVSSFNNWIVIQQRLSIINYFNYSWILYKNGFGSISGNHWLGLEKIHQLTSSASYQLRVEIQSVDQGKWFSAEYNSFLVDSESANYTINALGYVGDAGDSLVYHNGRGFNTFDKDNEIHCSSYFGSGWWYSNCGACDLNGKEPYWGTLDDYHLNPDATAIRMMIKHS